MDTRRCLDEHYLDRNLTTILILQVFHYCWLKMELVEYEFS